MRAESVHLDPAEPLSALARRALGFVKDDTAVGLGAGRAATAFLRALAARVGDGLRVRGVPVSEATAELARELGIPLVGLEADIDVTVDGADEVDPELNLIKGYGGALVRERIVAAASRRQIILVERDKLVPRLGSRGRLPVEVIPFALPLCRRRLAARGPPISRSACGRRSRSGRQRGKCVASGRATPASGRAPTKRAGSAGSGSPRTRRAASTASAAWPTTSRVRASRGRSCSAWEARASAPRC